MPKKTKAPTKAQPKQRSASRPQTVSQPQHITAKLGTKHRAVPYYNVGDFFGVYKLLFADNRADIEEGIRRVNVWKNRTSLPPAVEGTATLKRVQIQDAINTQYEHRNVLTPTDWPQRIECCSTPWR
eukprot:TRINITY_DN64074_c0_g1_i2.p1 TRINITY_DN64074_c0_g1~~TRINITY_DN64074_c0_g1_i2.p1  ORF type:complete len:127 (+),score=3.87 TRINITY_DN64074_c0_g1_i2:18-398(+)